MQIVINHYCSKHPAIEGVYPGLLKIYRPQFSQVRFSAPGFLCQFNANLRQRLRPDVGEHHRDILLDQVKSIASGSAGQIQNRTTNRRRC